jgi:hypothetical protein
MHAGKQGEHGKGDCERTILSGPDKTRRRDMDEKMGEGQKTLVGDTDAERACPAERT